MTKDNGFQIIRNLRLIVNLSGRFEKERCLNHGLELIRRNEMVWS